MNEDKIPSTYHRLESNFDLKKDYTEFQARYEAANNKHDDSPSEMDFKLYDGNSNEKKICLTSVFNINKETLEREYNMTELSLNNYLKIDFGKLRKKDVKFDEEVLNFEKKFGLQPYQDPDADKKPFFDTSEPDTNNMDAGLGGAGMGMDANLGKRNEYHNNPEANKQYNDQAPRKKMKMIDPSRKIFRNTYPESLQPPQTKKFLPMIDDLENFSPEPMHKRSSGGHQSGVNKSKQSVSFFDVMGVQGKQMNQGQKQQLNMNQQMMMNPMMAQMMQSYGQMPEMNPSSYGMMYQNMFNMMPGNGQSGQGGSFGGRQQMPGMGQQQMYANQMGMNPMYMNMMMGNPQQNYMMNPMMQMYMRQQQQQQMGRGMSQTVIGINPQTTKVETPPEIDEGGFPQIGNDELTALLNKANESGMVPNALRRGPSYGDEFNQQMKQLLEQSKKRNY